MKEESNTCLQNSWIWQLAAEAQSHQGSSQEPCRVCLRFVAPEDRETGASLHSSGPSLIGLACRDIPGVYLLADEHPSVAQEKAECRDPSAHVQCEILALVHGTVHQVRWPEGCDTVHHRYLPHLHPLSMSQPRRTFQNTNLLSKHSLNSYPQWFPIAHWGEKKSLPWP